MKRCPLLVTGLIVASLALSGCKTRESGTGGEKLDFGGEKLQIEGSTTVEPVATRFAEQFNKEYNADVTVSGGGSGNGIGALLDGRCDIAMSSRDMKDRELDTARQKNVEVIRVQVGIDGICVVVHPSNMIEGISRDDLQKIYTGRITNWRQLNGPDREVTVVTRDTNSGTYEMFNKKVLKGEKVLAGARTVGSNAEARTAVQNGEGAIAYVGKAFATEEVRAIPVDGVDPTEDNIHSGEYPLARALYFFTNGRPEPGSLKHAFLAFHISQLGAKLVKAAEYLPLRQY